MISDEEVRQILRKPFLAGSSAIDGAVSLSDA